MEAATDPLPPADGIQRAPVTSSNIASYGYDARRKILAVEFSSGAIFHYGSVDAGTWERFCDAPSKGRFYTFHIKGRFPGQKMTGPCLRCGDVGVIGLACDDCGCGLYEPEQREH